MIKGIPVKLYERTAKWDRYIRTSDIYRDTCDRGRRVGCSGIDNRSAGYA